jgi:hypothetical protein
MGYDLHAHELKKILKNPNSKTFDLHAYETARFVEAGGDLVPIYKPIIFYPTSDGSYSDPMLPGMYPVSENI